MLCMQPENIDGTALGQFRVEFRIRADLVQADRERFLGELAAGPVAPDEAEVGPDGLGWVAYSDVDQDERTEIARWLDGHPLVCEVL
jgi:hypothetical protein